MSPEQTPFTRESLIAAIKAGFVPEWCFFWGHTPAKDGSACKSFFSQWWAGHPFEINGIRYLTAEHYMMAEKARLFGDGSVLPEIVAAESPALAKKLGRRVADFDEAVWLRHRWDIVVRGNTAKFDQHPTLKEFLLQTGNKIIVEASPFDCIWGIGMASSHASAENPEAWKGLNLLGFALMAVRQKFTNDHDSQVDAFTTQ